MPRRISYGTRAMLTREMHPGAFAARQRLRCIMFPVSTNWTCCYGGGTILVLQLLEGSDSRPTT